jgi:hypothetical protein
METLKLMSKKEQYELFEALKPFIISNNETARMCDVSASLVSCVRQGINTNERVIAAIFQNLKDGWEDAVPTKYYSIIKSFL